MLTYPEGYEQLTKQELAQQELENQFNEPSFISIIDFNKNL